ncbi:unnamed protein product [Protopolystoma xenopodis]|uniref:NR LBD domain-containing protein n=1 Tax=Protopolystoma xenopodis TaxID=117903 RepID=A0A3S5A2M7_9PLAT|nr:unnamed protein product [Protopolystoma xenopodis]
MPDRLCRPELSATFLANIAPKKDYIRPRDDHQSRLRDGNEAIYVSRVPVEEFGQNPCTSDPLEGYSGSHTGDKSMKSNCSSFSYTSYECLEDSQDERSIQPGLRGNRYREQSGLGSCNLEGGALQEASVQIIIDNVEWMCNLPFFQDLQATSANRALHLLSLTQATWSEIFLLTAAYTRHPSILHLLGCAKGGSTRKRSKSSFQCTGFDYSCDLEVPVDGGLNQTTPRMASKATGRQQILSKLSEPVSDMVPSSCSSSSSASAANAVIFNSVIVSNSSSSSSSSSPIFEVSGLAEASTKSVSPRTHPSSFEDELTGPKKPPIQDCLRRSCGRPDLPSQVYGSPICQSLASKPGSLADSGSVPKNSMSEQSGTSERLGRVPAPLSEILGNFGLTKEKPISTEMAENNKASSGQMSDALWLGEESKTEIKKDYELELVVKARKIREMGYGNKEDDEKNELKAGTKATERENCAAANDEAEVPDEDVNGGNFGKGKNDMARKTWNGRTDDEETQMHNLIEQIVRLIGLEMNAVEFACLKVIILLRPGK